MVVGKDVEIEDCAVTNGETTFRAILKEPVVG